jgi:hypothetical protein
MVFQPSTGFDNNKVENNPITSPSVHGNQQTPVTHQYQQQQQQQMPVIEQSPSNDPEPQQLSESTSNDDIQELLVAILQELCDLKTAILSNDMIEKDEKEVESKESFKEEETRKPPQQQVMDFAQCF